MFLTLTLGDGTSSHHFFIMPQATCLLLSQKARKELPAGHMDFLAQVAEPSQKAECTGIEIEDDNGEECNCPTASEAFKPAKR